MKTVFKNLVSRADAFVKWIFPVCHGQGLVPGELRDAAYGALLFGTLLVVGSVAPLVVDGFKSDPTGLHSPSFQYWMDEHGPHLLTLALGLVCFLSAYAIIRVRPWLPHLVVVVAWSLGVIAPAVSLSKPGFDPNMILSLVFGIFLASKLTWFFYRKPEVRKYFRKGIPSPHW